MIYTSIWWWFVGHIICLSSSALLKTPVTKLASNWFGDKERGLATAIGIVSVPCGIFVSKLMTMGMLDDGDKIEEDEIGGRPYDETVIRFNSFMFYQCTICIFCVIPALVLIRDKPPSPPSMIATKPRPI